MMTKNDHYPLIPGPLIATNPIFKKLGILKVGDVFKLNVSKFIFSCILHTTPSNFYDWFTLNHTVHNYNTISSTNINIENYFDIGVVSNTNILHTKGSRIVNYGGKLLVQYYGTVYLLT